MPKIHVKPTYITQEYREKRTPVFMQRFQPDINGCWIWQGKFNHWGYGYFSIGRRTLGAHRAAWLLLRGDITGAFVVCHRCDVPACVNPDHLFLGNQLDNVRDMLAKGRDNYRKRQELCGASLHEMTEENTILRQRKLRSGKLSPSRECYACKISRLTKAHQENKFWHFEGNGSRPYCAQRQNSAWRGTNDWAEVTCRRCLQYRETRKSA